MNKILSAHPRIREILIPALICLLFFGVVLFLNSHHTEPLFKILPSEPDFLGQYMPDAYRILDGKLPTDRWRGPLYSVLLALSSFLREDLFENAKLISAISGTAFLMVVYLIARRISNRTTALLTLLLAASNSIVLLYSCAVGTDMLFAALTLGSLYLYLRAGKTWGWAYLIPAGILAGLGLMTRGSGVVLPAVVFASLLLNWSDYRNRIRGGVAFLLPMIIVCLPWFNMNYQLYGVPFHSDEYLTVAYTFFGKGEWQAFWQKEFMAGDRTFHSWTDVLTHDPVHLLSVWPGFLVRDLRNFARDLWWPVAGLSFLGMLLGTGRRPWPRQVKTLVAFGGVSLLLVSSVYYHPRFYLVLVPLWLLAAAWAVSQLWCWTAGRIGQRRSLWLVGGVVGLLLGFSGVASVGLVWRVFTSPSGATAEDYLWFADGYRQNGLQELAVAYYDKAAKVEPDSCGPLVEFADARLHWGEEEEALALYRDSLALDERCWQASMGMGELYLQKGETSEAAIHFDTAAKTALGPVDICVEIGNLYFDSGFVDEAKVYYERAMDGEPTNPLASIGLARIRQEQDDREGALSLYQQAMASAPGTVEPYLALGKAYRSWERWEEASKIYEKGLAVHPRVVELSLGMVEVYRAQGETELALKQCREAIKLAPEGSLPYLMLGDIYSDLGMVEEAIDAYEQAARRLPPLSVVYLHQGNLYRDHGMGEEAITAYDEAIRLDPASPSLYLIKGDACRRWDRVEEAMASYARAIELDPKLRGDLEGLQDLAGFLDASMAPAGDRVMFSQDWQERFVWYYSGGRIDVGEDSLVIEGHSSEEVRAEVFSVTSGADKWWLVLFRQPDMDPHSQAERILDEWGYGAVNRWYGEHRLVLFGMPMEGPPPEWMAKTADFGSEVELESYSLEESELEAGGVVKLGVRWRALADLENDYKVFIHIVGPDGKLWGQLDTVPGNGFRPTSGWEEGDAVEDRYGVLISTEAPPGAYELRIGLYHQENVEERLENRAADDGTNDDIDFCTLDSITVGG